MILDRIGNWKTYAGLHGGIARGLELLAGETLDVLPDGRHELDGDRLYASVQSYHPRSATECRWEAHHNYIDIQYLAAGGEVIGYSPVKNLQVVEPYDPHKDVIFFSQGPEAGTLLKLEAKMFAVFFPQDAHRPGLSWDVFPNIAPGGARASGRVKKIVLKVALKF